MNTKKYFKNYYQSNMEEGGVESNKPTENKLWSDSEAMKMIDVQKTLGMPTTMIHTDIDNTWFRQDRADDSKRLSRDARELSVPIHAVTGNNFEAVLKRIESGELPYFQVISSKVGTERYILKFSDGKPTYVRDTDYDLKMAGTGCNRPHVVTESQKLLSEISPSADLNFQKPDIEKAYLADEHHKTESPYKVSFYFFADSTDTLKNIHSSFQSKFPDQKIIICEEIGYNEKMQPGDKRKKFCLDVLPISKADAVNDVVGRVGSQVNIVNGDSGNDIGMLTESGDVAVLVGGAKPEISQAIEQIIQDYNQSIQRTELSGNFEQVIGNAKKWYFREREQNAAESLPDQRRRLGPQSINYALRVLVRGALLNPDKITQAYGPVKLDALRAIYDRLSVNN